MAECGVDRPGGAAAEPPSPGPGAGWGHPRRGKIEAQPGPPVTEPPSSVVHPPTIDSSARTGLHVASVPFAIVDRDRDGSGVVLMIVDDRPEAEMIAIELRRKGVRADVVAVTGARTTGLSTQTAG